MNNRILATTAILVYAVLLGGCAQRGLYQWGGYDAMLYQSYKNPEKVADLRTGLVAHIGAMEKSQQKVAPGLYAELGTLYLQAGDTVNASAMYAKEREAWPESKTLMDALIANLGKRSVPTADAPKAEVKL